MTDAQWSVRSAKLLFEQQVNDFRAIVWEYYAAHGRDLPWRQQPTPYHVLVSEFMLQQTQVSRVIPKYADFLQRFPTIDVLAEAPLANVLEAWNGLGYNRRAKFLHAAARDIIHDWHGQIPRAIEELVRLPGVGHNTAGAIIAYAYNDPIVFIETNIRTVFFHHFFTDIDEIDDKELVPLLWSTLDKENPREWYWALMDYGTHLKSIYGNNNMRSRHYSRQSTFEGSRRQLRGKVIRSLLSGPVRMSVLIAAEPDERLDSVVHDLIKEGLVSRQGNLLRLTGQRKLP